MLTRYRKLHPYLLQMVTDIEDNITLLIGKNKIIYSVIERYEIFAKGNVTSSERRCNIVRLSDSI